MLRVEWEATAKLVLKKRLQNSLFTLKINKRKEKGG